MGKELQSVAWVAVRRQELERCFAREQRIWPDVVGVSVGEGCGELMVQRGWKMASADFLRQCSSVIDNGKPFIIGFRPVSDEVGVVPEEHLCGSGI